jgi:DNA-binding GntR family transcriptional regulator
VTVPSKLYRHEQPLREIVSADLRSRIFRGLLPPGARLVERDLADELEVSRFPVREALRILHQEGLVENLPTRGTVVKRLERREVEEIFDIREMLEALASRSAAGRVAAGIPSRLRDHVLESRRAWTSGDLDAAHASNTEFHDDIIDLSGNLTLQNMLTPLLGRLHWLFRQISDFEQVCLEHAALCDAIEAGEPEAAAAEAQRHVLSYRTQTLQHLFG